MLYNPNWNTKISIVDLSNPTLQNLIYVLRHPDIWPEDFEWNYYSPSTCAMGLAYQLWPDHIGNTHSHTMAECFGMDHEDSWDIFMDCKAGLFNTIMGRSPTAKQVANKLEKYLAKQH